MTRNFSLALALICAWASPPALAEDRTLNDGIFTEAQADSGEALYEQHCLTCHDEKYFRPVLKRYQGQPLGLLYTVMVTSMPQSNPGALPLDEYASILAYILSESRYKAGDSELASEPEALNTVTITKRQ